MVYASMFNAVITLATIATLSAIGITIYDTIRNRKRKHTEEEVAEGEHEESKPSILQRFVKQLQNKPEVTESKEREGGGIKIVLEMPRVIYVKVDPNDLIAYLFTKKKVEEAEVEEVEEVAEGEEEGRVSTEVLLRKGLVKEG